MPTITFGGVGSGIDVESIIEGLVNASRTPLKRVEQKRTDTTAAVSSVSDIGSLLGKLKTAAADLDQVRDVGSFKVSSSGDELTATASGTASAGSFEIEVTQLATAYKAYSNGLAATSNAALGQNGTLSLSVGGKSADITISETDTLDSVTQKINAAGLRVSASTLYDGGQFRLQLRGLDTGKENDVTVTENGTTFGFEDVVEGVSNVKTRGDDAQLTVDGFAVTSSSNRVSNVIGGVTLALTKKTTEPVTLTVESDASAMGDKLKTFVDAYNAVINKIHAVSGFGSIKASNSVLAGDSSLRSVTSQLGRLLTETVGDGKFSTLRSIGIELRNDGTLNLNRTQLDKALAEDPSALARVLAGDDDSQLGIMDRMTALTTNLVSAKGLIEARKDGLNARVKSLGQQRDVEEARLARMEELLRKQFNQMDQTVALINSKAGMF